MNLKIRSASKGWGKKSIVSRNSKNKTILFTCWTMRTAKRPMAGYMIIIGCYWIFLWKYLEIFLPEWIVLWIFKEDFWLNLKDFVALIMWLFLWTRKSYLFKQISHWTFPKWNKKRIIRNLRVLDMSILENLKILTWSFACVCLFKKWMKNIRTYLFWKI